VLIFDEITSGWRMNVGGIHRLYKVYPDIAVYGKAMSNSFPMSVVIGKGGVMEAAETSFISSIYWTDRVGPTAAIATINKMLEKNVPSHLCKIGNAISDGWKKIARENELKIDILDAIPPLITFEFNYGDKEALRTLFTQEMLKRGFSASKSVYVSYAHNEDHIGEYLENVSDVFRIIRKAIEQRTIYDLLEGPVIHTGFRRLT
jgi:glutamate-1-semialdehyde aminotransferase